MIARRLCIAGLLMFAFSGARAETVNCTEITALPYSISTPGAYCLAQDLKTWQAGGSGIFINASNVTLDCNGHGLTDARTNSSDKGIWTIGRSSVTIANCRITGFSLGILLGNGSSNATIRGNTIRNATVAGMQLWGRDIRVLDNSVIDSKGSGANFIRGILVSGFDLNTPARDLVFRGNRVVGVWGYRPTAMAIGNAIAPIIEGNHIGRIWTTTGGAGYGISLSPGARAVIRDNVLTGAPSYHVTAVSADDSTVCAGNMVVGFRTGITGCVEANDVVD
jgi:parallel beta-helix repeat protein